MIFRLMLLMSRLCWSELPLLLLFIDAITITLIRQPLRYAAFVDVLCRYISPVFRQC